MSDATAVLNLVNDTVFVSLVNTTLQMTLIISIVALVIWMLRMKSATIRYSLWLFVLFAIIVLPALTPFIPQMDFSRFHHQRGEGEAPTMRLGTGTGDAGELPEVSVSVPSASAAKAAVNREMDVSLINPVSVAYFIWCAGALFMSCITISIYTGLRKLRLRSHDVESQTALDMLSRLKDKLGVRGAVGLKASSEVYTPMSMGIFSPVIIVPNSVMDDSSYARLEMILTHELAHIRRRDYLVKLLQNILRAIFFFHPLLHLMNRNLAREREHICDDWVIDVTNLRSKYAECLVSLLERAVYKPVKIPVSIAMAERKQDIPGRIDMIVDRKRKVTTSVSKKALIVMLTIGCLSLPIMGGIELVRFAGAQARKPAQIAFLFQHDQNAKFEIYIMDADGENPRNLTNHPADYGEASWSPDGRSIAFHSNQDGNLEIYVMDVDGKNLRNLTNNPATDAGPSWSPDGRSIAFHSGRDDKFATYVMDADGKNPRWLTDHASWPVWSPDGQSIAFTSTRDDNLDVYVMDADGKNERRLTNNPAWDFAPSWSPDSQSVAFTTKRDGDLEIYVMDADGKNKRNLTNNPNAWDDEASWSPDGQSIAFGSNRASWEIYVMDADGKNQRNLTNSATHEWAPAWFDPAFAYAVSPVSKLRSTWGKIKRGLSFR